MFALGPESKMRKPFLSVNRGIEIPASEITPESVWLNRRNILRAAAVGVALSPGTSLANPEALSALRYSPVDTAAPSSVSEDPTPYDAITSYNNF